MTTRAAWTQSDEEDGATQLEGVTVIVPAYNEEGGIGPTLEELVKIMAASELQHEIVVIDDGSTDRTAEVAGQHAVRLVRHKTNAGYGDALKTGIRLARYPLIAITDADGTYPNDRLAELVNVVASQDADMVVGARTGPEVAIPLIRRPAKWLIGRLAELAAGRAIPDLNSGLRVFRRATAMRMLSLLPSGFSFTTTITLAMLNNGYTVEYLPVNYYARTGRSKIRPIRDTLNFVMLILRIALYFAPLKIFLPLSGLLWLLSMAVGFYTWLVVGVIADVTIVLVALAAFQMAAIGLLAELINKRLPSAYRDDQ